MPKEKKEAGKKEGMYAQTQCIVMVAAALSVLPILFTISYEPRTLFLGSFVATNTLVRLFFPSSYVPAS